MRWTLRSLIFIGALVAAVEARAEHPSWCGIHRYFGIGWGDGYHVQSHPCRSCAYQSDYSHNVQSVAPVPVQAPPVAPVPLPQPLPPPVIQAPTALAPTVPVIMAPVVMQPMAADPRAFNTAAYWAPQAQFQQQPVMVYGAPASSPMYVQPQAMMPAQTYTASRSARVGFPSVSIP